MIIIMYNMEYLEPIFYMLIGIFWMLFMIFWQVDKIYEHITTKCKSKYKKPFKKYLEKDFQWKKTNQQK